MSVADFTTVYVVNPATLPLTKTLAVFSPDPERARSPDAALEAVIGLLAPAQHGVVARAQLLQAGITGRVIDRRLKTGRLRPLHRGVYLVGPLRGRHTNEMAAVLACGSAVVVSHRSGMVLRDVLSVDGSTIVEVSTYPAGAYSAAKQVRLDRCALESARTRVRCAASSRPGIRVHRVSTLRPEDVTVYDGIPVTTVARTLYDLARTAPAHEVESALAHALDRRMIDAGELRAWLGRRSRHAGAPRLQALLDSDQPPALLRSAAEARFLALVRKAQLPDPQCNVRVRGFEVDFYWRAERFAVEMDGFAYHASSRAFESDRRRDAVLVSAGIRVMRVTWKQLENEREATLARLTRALARSDVG